MANRVRPITVTEADRHELERLQRVVRRSGRASAGAPGRCC